MPTVHDHDPIKVTKLHDAILRQTQRWRQQHSPSIDTSDTDDEATAAAKPQTHERNLHPSQRIQTRPSASTLTARIDPLHGHVIEPHRIIPPLRVRRTDVLVVGGGPAGLSAALSAKRVASSPSVDRHRRALDVTLVESAGYFGGTITKTGMETMGWYRYPGTRECHAGLGREMEKRAERMGFASKWPFNESVCLHPHHFKYVADCLVREAGVRPLLHSRVVEVIMDDGEDCERELEETDGDDENDGRFRTIRGVILETPSGREAILAKRIVDTTGDAIVAYLAGAPFRKTHKSEMMGVTTVFGMEGVDKARFEEHVRQNQATYKDWNTESWEALTTGKEDGIASPYWGKIFEEAAKEGIIDANGYGAITNNMDQASIDEKQESNTKTNSNHSKESEQQSPTPQTSQSQTTPKAEVDICGSWSAISPSGVATNLNLIHMKHIDPTDSDDVTRAEMTGRHHVYSAMNALRAKVPGFENATLNSVSAHLGVRDSRYLDSHGNHRLSGWHVTNEGTCHDSIGVFPEFVDGYNILILPTTGRVFEVPLSMMIPKRVDNLILAGRHVDVDPIACAAMRNMMACAVTGQGAGVAAAVSVWEDTTVREVDMRKVQRELRKQGVSLSKAELLEKEERSSDDGDKNEIVGCGDGAKRDGTPRLTSKL